MKYTLAYAWVVIMFLNFNKSPNDLILISITFVLIVLMSLFSLYVKRKCCKK